MVVYRRSFSGGACQFCKLFCGQTDWVSLNIVLAGHVDNSLWDSSVLWGFISRYADNATPENMPFLDRLVTHAIHYYEDFVKPHKKYKTPDENETNALNELLEILTGMDNNQTTEEFQTLVQTW